jgi:anthranilate synthase/aminodeoxychorismate synthase-like glutamine amidotransferase
MGKFQSALDRWQPLRYGNAQIPCPNMLIDMSILILDNYDSFTYNLYQLVQAQTDAPVRVIRNNQLDWPGLMQLAPDRIIISPGPGHPAKEADFGICREVVLRHQELACPILGICLGHQGLAHYLGGSVVPAPAIVHGKTSSVRIVADSPLLAGLPNPFTVMRYHSWVVDSTSLPPDFEVSAQTDSDAPLMMAMQHRAQPLYGVQFHPESVGTPQGAQLLANFLAIPSLVRC